MIVLESVCKRFGAKTVVDDVSFSVRGGEIVGFLGPNGAGKTTTLRMIAGFTTATSGRVSVCGFDMARDNVEAARHIGYLPERPPLYDNLDVSACLRFVAKVKGLKGGEMASELARVISACKLEPVFRHEIFKLSKGYRQRVGLAQALLGNPGVLLLDEPTNGLDPAQIQETREVIRAAGQVHAVLLSTHILPEVTLICDRVAIIDHGRLLAIDTPSGLQRALEETRVLSLRVTDPAEGLQEALLSLDGVRAVDIKPSDDVAGMLSVDCRVDDREGIAASVARVVAGRWELHQLRASEASLENIFLHYVGQPDDYGGSA
jgi:ABC-2 type transport system ATP-binding protein